MTETKLIEFYTTGSHTWRSITPGYFATLLGMISTRPNFSEVIKAKTHNAAWIIRQKKPKTWLEDVEQRIRESHLNQFDKLRCQNLL